MSKKQKQPKVERTANSILSELEYESKAGWKRMLHKQRLETLAYNAKRKAETVTYW